MEPYGSDFRSYYLEKRDFFEVEDKKQIWIWLGVVFHCVLAFTGMVVLPAAYLNIWLIALIISSTLVISALLSMWWRQRKYYSFERWLKYREKDEPSGASGIFSDNH